MRAPVFGEFAKLFLGRLAVEAQQLANLDLHREVARRPDVAAAFGEQQVDFRRPTANALDFDQLRDCLLIVFRQVGQVEFA